ncbi:GTP 3',8-cyclase MoaA [Helicobacter cappadocius]|uniref:GTP 3',8-cyclase n=1 Tax=Helicobacter cappadocius TaxID=3063998 RepID=A0AA90PPI1_9HELI|nr:MULTISPECIES: GTP 3',8-cyclase MoaA [unclassified Helicobacter]MDO7252404.1 GTP 3',8-cyclase MoaA [Helicobacter sp. faydin-H75]MDP2538271.1 GTP 3',8-cyclase MoaA [Helicobacter sp. faydin-H76]
MLIDTFGRTIDYIRVSVTKQCNFRCQYCMPDTPMDFYEDENHIPLEAMATFLKIAIDEGIKKIRITGGEPLLRKDLSTLISSIHKYAPEVEIALTSNAFLLKKYALSLKQAGLERINISLDSLKPDRIIKISKKDALKSILEGIDEAQKVGLKIKLNMVPIKGINDDEIIEILEFARSKNITLRYIEYMENTHAKNGLKGLKEVEILDIVKRKYPLKLIEKENFGPAKIYVLQDNYVFGIIAPHNDDFCKTCNRIRITSEGTICPCLYYQESVDAKPAILSRSTKQMKDALLESVQNKPEKNLWNEEMKTDEISARAFYYTGG